MEKRMVEVITRDIAELFSFTEEELFFLKAEHGAAYLNAKFTTDQSDITDALKRNPQFWAWWAQMWAERDRLLLSRCERRPMLIKYTFPIGKERKVGLNDSYIPSETIHISIEDTWEFYKKYHSPGRIKYYPNYVLIRECIKVQQNNFQP